MAAYFTNAFNTFFKELAGNNHKEWFDANRKRYHSDVKEPFYAFVADLIEHIQLRDQTLELEVKNAVFRINNDIRFHKNKPLYKTHVGASIAKGGRKNGDLPSFYVHLSPGECFVAAGCYKPSKEALQAIRSGIATDVSRFEKLLQAPKLKGLFGELGMSEVNKVLPKELKASALDAPVLYNKQFYVLAEYARGESFVLQPDLMQKVLTHYDAAKDFLDYLAEFTRDMQKK